MTREWTTPEAWTDNKAISTDRLNAISTQLGWLYKTLAAGEGSALTIASGVISVTGNESYYEVSGEGAAADDLVTINGGTEGDIIILAYDGEDITLKDGIGNIVCAHYDDVVLGSMGSIIALRYDGSNWGVLFTNVIKSRLATGTFSGDGSTSQGITGVGFPPKHVKTWPSSAAATAIAVIYETTDTLVDNSANGLSLKHLNTGGHDIVENAIISLDADGFTVDDDGIDSHPNASGQSYDYVAWG